MEYKLLRIFSGAVFMLLSIVLLYKKWREADLNFPSNVGVPVGMVLVFISAILF